MHLHQHVTNGTVPVLEDIQPPTMASKAPQYESLDQLEMQMEDKRRGIRLKPHYVTADVMELHEKRTDQAAKRKAKKKWS